MLPAYYVSPERLLRVAFAVAELGENPERSEIEDFTGLNTRVVREAVNIGEEIGLFYFDEMERGPKLDPGYQRDLSVFSQSDRSLVLYDVLLHYQPFMQFVSYLNSGYSPDEAARQVNTIAEVASGDDYVKDYFTRYGEYAGILSINDEVTVEIKSGKIPGNPSKPVQQLQDSLASEAEVRLYLESLLGEEIAGVLPDDVFDQIVGAFTTYESDPRDSITESGRALEDYLRWLGDRDGDPTRDYQGASGIVPLANHLKGDSLITETHKKNLLALGARRNTAAHGRSVDTMDRWAITEEGALSTALDTSLIIRSVHQYVDRDRSMF